MNRRQLLIASLVVLFASSTWALDHVSLRRDDKPIHVDGKVLVEATDGGLLVLDRQGILWSVLPDELVKHEQDEVPFELFDQDGLGDQLLREMPAGFKIHTTANYIVCYNTSDAYAEWSGALFERLYLAFRNYWKKRGSALTDPDGPLVAIVFDNKADYAKYFEQEVGQQPGQMNAYYSVTTNRMAMYDLTGLDRAGGRDSTTAARVNRLLQHPKAERNVATIIHEATHQLAFNSGLHTRHADIPKWFSEGMAMYFETPDLRSSRGWRNIGSVNRVRLAEFRHYAKSRPSNSLATLIASPDRFRSYEAYAESWALTYFLIRKHPKEYAAYLEHLAAKPRLLFDSPEERIADFEAIFGDLGTVNAAFVRYMRGVR